MTDEDAVELEAAGRDDEVGDLTLADVLIAASEGLAGVTRAAAPDGTRWSVRGSPFAFLAPGGDAAEFRLDGAIAAAALRTPGTSPSDQGREWVRFAPDVLDDGAVDRAEAWFHSAHRRAGR
jgi:hypothetical protein